MFSLPTKHELDADAATLPALTHQASIRVFGDLAAPAALIQLK
jgi:hypothetical protein